MIRGLSRTESHAGCGFLAADEIERWLEGRLEGPRQREFHRHQLEGCSACALLSADLEVFHGVASRGLLDSEQREFGRTEAVLKAHMRQKLESTQAESAGKRRWLSWSYALGTATAALFLLAIVIPIARQQGEVSAVPALSLPGGVVEPLQPVPPPTRPLLRGPQVSLAELWQQGVDASEAGHYQAAARLFSEITERIPEDADASTALGNALLMTGRFDAALAVLERALELSLRNGDSGSSVYFLIGQAAAGTGDMARAREALAMAVAGGGLESERASRLLEKMRD